MQKLSELYRPQTLGDVVGQPEVNRLIRLAARPRPSCWLLESGPGTGKSSAAYALAHDLGCYSSECWETAYTLCGADLTADAARYWFIGEKERSSPLRLCAPNGWNMLIIEELEMVSAVCQRLLKDYLERRLSTMKCIVVATSNGAGALDAALLERFEILSFQSGVPFAEACQERLAAIWEQESPGTDMPGDWLAWGWVEDADHVPRFSMRKALDRMAAALESRESEVRA